MRIARSKWGNVVQVLVLCVPACLVIVALAALFFYMGVRDFAGADISSMGPLFWLGIIFGVFGATLLTLVGLWCVRQWRAYRDLKERAKRHFSVNCTSVTKPVIYEGWDGSVQVFWFANDRYAEQFQRANPDKIVG